MESLYHIRYNTRDRLLRAWEETMELVRKFETYSHEIDEKEESALFAESAEEVALMAARFFEKLQAYER